MEIKKIIDELQIYNPNIICKVSEPTYIQTVKIMQRRQSALSPDCLYLGYVSYLPELNIDKTTKANIICISDIPLPGHYYTYNNLYLILIDNDVNLHDVLNKIADTLLNEARFISDMNLLLDAFYADLGLQKLIDVAYDIFANPIGITDTAYKILAYSRNAEINDPTYKEQSKLGYIHEINLNAAKRDNFFVRARKSKHPVYLQRPEDSLRWLVKSIRINNIVVGEVGMVEYNQPFRSIDYELLDRFESLIALEMSKNKFYEDNKGIMYNYLLGDLLSGNLRTTNTIMQRLRYLNWKIYDYFKIMVLFDQKAVIGGYKGEKIGQQLRQIIPDCHWCVYQNNIVVLLSRPQAEIFTLNEKKMLEEFLLANELSAGVSNHFSNILDAQKYYRQALKIGEIGVYKYNKQGLLEYADYITALIGETLSNYCDLVDFYHPAILLIHHYDLKHNSQLLNTLECYLQYVDNPKITAEKLNIHKNT